MPDPIAPALYESVSIEEIAAAARARGRIVVDTEFVGERRYWALLCLAGIATDPAEPGGPVPVALVDPIAGDEPGELPALLADPEIEVVVHAGRQDMAILRRAWRTEVRNVFDTQIAAGFAGLGAQTGYGRLVSAVLHHTLPKGETFARWDERPLRPKALDYAREDVAHLPALADALARRLRDAGRLEWAREECRWLETVSDERDPEEAFRRLPRVRQLKPRDVPVVKELAAWRERTAAAEDKAVRSVIGDQQVLELAQRRPEGRRGLREVRGLHPRTVDRRGAEILAAIERGAGAPPIKLDERRATDPDDVPLVALAEAVVRYRAREAGLAYELVTSKDELGTFVAAARRGREPQDVRMLAGWREQLVGHELRELLAGRVRLAVAGGRLEITAD